MADMRERDDPNAADPVFTLEHLALIEHEALRRGYVMATNGDGTEKRLIRPDGSVAVIARKDVARG